jgi:hypothetical protein
MLNYPVGICARVVSVPSKGPAGLLDFVRPEWGLFKFVDDTHGFVVDQGPVVVLSKLVILFYSVFKQCVAHVLRQLLVVFA